MKAEELKDRAAMFLEELHISGDTMVSMDHNMDDVPEMEHGALNLHDVMANFVLEEFANSQSQWISVEDRLPESDTRVLVYGVWDSSEMESEKEPDVGHAYYDGSQWMVSGALYGYCWFKDVTHWQPLPTKPNN